MAEATILLIEDEPDLVKLMEKQLTREGFRVVSCRDALAGLETFRKAPPDAILLDLMLPGMSGFDFTRTVRKESRVPILMVTARAEETDRVVGLELGADDYITKPFSIRELTARIKAVLRRTRGGAEPAARLKAGGIEVDRARHEARAGDRPLDLTLKEFELLCALMEADGRVLSREDLLNGVWGYQRAADLDTRTVDQHVARLRKKLGAEGARVETVKAVGYRMAMK